MYCTSAQLTRTLWASIHMHQLIFFHLRATDQSITAFAHCFMSFYVGLSSPACMVWYTMEQFCITAQHT